MQPSASFRNRRGTVFTAILLLLRSNERVSSYAAWLAALSPSVTFIQGLECKKLSDDECGHVQHNGVLRSYHRLANRHSKRWGYVLGELLALIYEPSPGISSVLVRSSVIVPLYY